MSNGDIVNQNVNFIVNAWNRNLLPWWLLIPQGVSAAIKRAAGSGPFRELRRYGLLAVGDAVLTGAGRLPIKGIVHVAGIGLDWRASERSIVLSVVNAIHLASVSGCSSIAFPLIGAGTGGLKEENVERLMLQTLARLSFHGDVHIVRYSRSAAKIE